MSFTRDMLAGLAQILSGAGIGTWTPDETDGTIHLGPVPADAAQGIGLTAYGIQADPAMADVVQPVQIFLRGQAQWVDDTADAVFELLHGSARVLGPVAAWLVTLYSDVRMGVDGKGLTERSLNYYFSANRPTAGRPD